MSQGSKIVPVRMPPALLAEIQIAVDRHNQFTLGEPLTVSEWIRRAVVRDIAHSVRSRQSRRTSRA